MNYNNKPISVFWFRRDLRFEDNVGLYHALKGSEPVLPLFIFDSEIIEELPKEDARVNFIHNRLNELNKQLNDFETSLWVEKGNPLAVFKKLTMQFKVAAVYTNNDYEPYATNRDKDIKEWLLKSGIPFYSYKDHVIREYNEVLKKDNSPYTVYTPYAKLWLAKLNDQDLNLYDSKSLLKNLIQRKEKNIPPLKELGFIEIESKVEPYCLDTDLLAAYEQNRNIPAINGTSHLGTYLRFGIISIREVIRRVGINNISFIKQLIWREFFIQIMHHFKHVVNASFKPKYDHIPWLNNEYLFDKWCKGETGYPIVDAGMRELNNTGYMHNRVRMITASFLCKHLLIDWRWGEAYFASKLLDYELAVNNGNWQWAAGTGCDAAPYFRIFNPYTQQQKFDGELEYVKKWVSEFGTTKYCEPIVDHKEARELALKTYKQALMG